MLDNHLNGNNNNITIIVYQPTIVVVNDTPNQHDGKKVEPKKDKPSLWERLKPFLGFGGAVADFIKKILPLILSAFGINSS